MKPIRSVAPILALVCGVILTAACGKPEDKSGMVGKPAPDFAVTPLHPAGDQKLSSFRGQVVLLDFWATWCGPCHKLIPHLVALNDKYKDKGFKVIGIANQSRDVVFNFLNENPELKYDLFLDLRADASRKYKAFALPTTVLIGKDGKVEYYSAGFDDNSLRELDEKVDDLVKS